MRAPFIGFAAGLLAVGGFSPLNLYPLPVIGLAVLFALWRAAPCSRSGFLTGLGFGLGYFGAGVSWIYISLAVYGGMAGWLAGLATLLFCLVLALFPAIAGAIQARWRGHEPARLLLVIPALWVLLEWTRGWFLTGFPWLAVGYSQVPDSPLAGFAPLFGVYGVSFMAALAASLLAWSAMHRRSRSRLIWGLCGTLAVATGGQGLRQVNWTMATDQPTSVTLVQGNISQDMKWQPEKVADSLVLYARLAAAYPAQLVILPETALPMFESELPPKYRARLRAIGLQHGGDILTGLATGSLYGAYFNSVKSFGKAPSQAYHKVHLVPIGEFIPLRFLWGWVERVLHIPLSDFARGSPAQTPLLIGGQRVAVNICYEDAFGEEIIRQLPAASVLVNVSNDAWFGDSLMPWQHTQMSQMRALEAGRMMLRATNTGVTAIIGVRGDLTAYLPPFSQGALRGTVQGYSGSTPYVRFGNLPILLVCVLALLLGAWRGKARTALAPVDDASFEKVPRRH